MQKLDVKKLKRYGLLLICMILANYVHAQPPSEIKTTSKTEVESPSSIINKEPIVKPVVSTAAKTLLDQAKEAEKAKKFERAINLATQAIGEQPDHAEAFQFRGSRYGDIKNYPAAIEDFKMFARLKPDNADARGNLGWYLILNQQFSEAQQASQKAVALDSHSMAWTVNLGHSYLLLSAKFSSKLSPKNSLTTTICSQPFGENNRI